MRTLTQGRALVGQGLMQDEYSAGPISSSKQIVVTVSRELTAGLGAWFSGHALNRWDRWDECAFGLAAGQA